MKRYLILLAWIIAFTATCGSLYFSLGLGLTPCDLCWYARILMYPMASMCLIAVIRSDVKIIVYTLPLTILGVALTLYHTLLQFKTVNATFCSPGSESCSQIQWNIGGVITIPVLALTAFLLLLVIQVVLLILNRGDK